MQILQIFPFFSGDSDVTLGILAVHFWTSFRHEIRWCFGLARGCVGRSSELKLGAWQFLGWRGGVGRGSELKLGSSGRSRRMAIFLGDTSCQKGSCVLP